MKKVLILVDQINVSNTLLAASIREELKKGDTCTLASFSDVFFRLHKNNVRAMVNGVDITSFDLVHFRKTGKRFLSMAYTLAVILEKSNVRLVNTTYNSSGASGDKFTALTKLTLANLPTIESFLLNHASLPVYAKVIESTLKYPFVVKDRFMQRGAGVSLIKNKLEFKKLMDNKSQKSFIFQAFVPAKQEFRLLVLGRKVQVFERKVLTDKSEFRANVALGAREEFMPLASMPKAMSAIAIKAASVLKLQVAGVDIMEDTSGKFWLLEVNRGPGITHDKSVSPELTQMGQFFARELSFI